MIYKYLSMLLFVFCFQSTMFAQTKSRINFESGLTFGTSCDVSCYKVLPVGVELNVNYAVTPRFKAYVVSQNDYFFTLQSSGENGGSLSLGGGLGFMLIRGNKSNCGDFELRSTYSKSITSDTFRNGSFDMRIYWHSTSGKKGPRPVLGIGYTCKTFSNPDISTYQGATLSLGIVF